MPLVRINNKVILFVHVPKTGGTSIKEHLTAFGSVALVSQNDHAWPDCNAQHMHAAAYNRIIPDDFYDYSFMVVRNPYDRIVSEYRMRRRDLVVRGLPTKGFSEWAEGVLRRYRNNKYLLDNHIRPQAEFHLNRTDVFKYEDGLSKIIEAVARITATKIDTNIKHNNESEKVTIRVSPNCAELIRKFYIDDFKLFGYEDEPDYLIEKHGVSLEVAAMKYLRLTKYGFLKLARRRMRKKHGSDVSHT